MDDICEEEYDEQEDTISNIETEIQKTNLED